MYCPAVVRQRSTRERVLRLVQAFPGIPLTTLASRTGVCSSTVAYHLRVLETAGFARTRVVGRRRLAYPSSAAKNENNPKFAFLRHPTARTVAQALAESPGAEIPVLLEMTRASPRALYHHLKRLREFGLVQTESRRSYRGLRPTESLKTFLSRLDRESSTMPSAGPRV